MNINRIINYLLDDKKSCENKEKLIAKKSSLLSKNLSLLPDAILINLFASSNISDKIKKDLKKLLTKEKQSSILPNPVKNIQNNFVESDSHKDIFSNSGKVINYLNDKLISYDDKKIIIDELFTGTFDKICDKDFIIVNLEDKKIIEYTSKKITNTDDIIYYVKTTIDDNFFKRSIVDNCVNEKNIYKIMLNGIFDDYKRYIFNRKQEVIHNYIHNIKSSDLLPILKKAYLYEPFKDLIYKERIKDIYKEASKLSLFFDEATLLYENDERITNAILDTHDKRIYLTILFNPLFDPIDWLFSNKIPSNIKKFIYQTKTLKINTSLKNASFEKIKSNYLLSEAYNDTYVQLLYEKYIDINKKKIINYINKCSINELIYDIEGRHYPMDIINYIINNQVNINNITMFLESDIDFEIKKRMIDQNAETMKNYIKTFENDIYHFNLGVVNDKQVINYITKKYYNEFLSIIKKDNIHIYEPILLDQSIHTGIKLIVIKQIGFNDKECENVLSLLNICSLDILQVYYKKIDNIFKKAGINTNDFIRYGSGSQKYKDWLIKMINLIEDNEVDSFTEVFKYLNKYYYNNKDKENSVYLINNFLEVLFKYNDNIKELLIDIASNKVVLSDNDKKNLNIIFNVNDIPKVTSYKKLDSICNSIYTSTKENLKIYCSTYFIKKILNDMFLANAQEDLSTIGGTTALKMLQLTNKDSKSIKILSDELILYSQIIDLISKSNDLNELEKLANNIFSDKDQFVKTMNLFYNLKTKINNLFELEAKVNLTNLEENKNKDGVLNYDLMKKYGGLVYDFSDKNYILYAHILSRNENVKDFINGISNRDYNFMSVSPVSYKGQKYYYDYANMIFAFDKIPNGSYVCSSTKNMGSNGFLTYNSSEVERLINIQRGILETSAVRNENSETLLFREGLKPCGIILVGGKKPNERELRIHKDYDLPFIITQKSCECIENPKMIFSPNDQFNVKTDMEELKELVNIISPIIVDKKEDNIYTGRQVAVLADAHALFDPTFAILEDIKKLGIKEIYSLGDNIGSGPNPKETIDLLDKYNVISLLGNSECYMTLGTEPFTYLDEMRKENEEWTFDKLGQDGIARLKTYMPSKDIIIGDQKIALCHFANDIRWDYPIHSTWTFQDAVNLGKEPKQLYYTNSDEAIKEIKQNTQYYDKYYNGYKDALINPLFDGKKVIDYDAIIQGHVHFDSLSKLDKVMIKTLRGVAIGFEKSNKNMACYYVLKERKDGKFDIEQKLVPYNRQFLISNIETSSLPHKEKILSFLK